jgi:hypothetical protein
VRQHIDTDRFPEWQPFLDAVRQRRPDAGTWCEAWTVRDSRLSGHPSRRQRWGARPGVLGAHLEGTTIELAEPDGLATLETDAAARVLLLWGRRPGDPSRICRRVGPETLGRVPRLLSGY